MKGAEDVMLRAKAISTTATALGPAYGQTIGSYIGTSGTLGRYQNMARGGVYELAGAGINFANAGTGAFSQMGLSTIAMMDRGAANMLNNYKDRQAAGKGGAGLMSGGTEWLRRYGDLFSNLGNIGLNLAPYEPGIGGDVLNTLVGGTGFLKQMTQDIPGPILGAIMAVEGGPALVGRRLLGGKGLLGRVLGLRKVGGLGGLIGRKAWRTWPRRCERHRSRRRTAGRGSRNSPGRSASRQRWPGSGSARRLAISPRRRRVSRRFRGRSLTRVSALRSIRSPMRSSRRRAAPQPRTQPSRMPRRRSSSLPAGSVPACGPPTRCHLRVPTPLPPPRGSRRRPTWSTPARNWSPP